MAFRTGGVSYLCVKLFVAYLIALVNNVANVNGQAPIRKFEYKYSFKPPYLAQKDGSVPFWEYGGNAIASSENVRIAPSMRSQKGAIWTKQPLNFDYWDIDIMFRITGRGRIGADGLAFWYVTQKGDYAGDVFGSSDKWNGLGVFFDSFDNDNKHNNPYIMAVVNDGTRNFDHQNDGSTQMLSGCLRDFRNKPYPTRARIEYFQNTLTLLFHNGMTNNEADYEMCFRVENVILPKGGYFGLSAATGGLADDHDVIHFLSFSLSTPGSQTSASQVNVAEQEKLSQEYADYQKKLDQHKEDYRKEHPDEKEKDAEFEDWFESDNQRELRQIFQGQQSIYDVVRELHKKVDEVIGKQVNSLSMLSALYSHQQGVAPVQTQPGQAAPQMPPGLPVGRHEWDLMMQNQNVFVNTLNEVKTFLQDVSRKSDSILQGQARAPTAHVQNVGYDNQAFNNEVRDSINQVKQGITQIGQRISSGPAGQAGCPNVSCVSVTTLLGVILAQTVVFFLYGLYRDRKESQAKKFY